MAEQAPTLTRHDLEAKIVKRCWEEEEFRKEFTTDPAAAFVKYLEIPAASLPKISVHQEEPGSWHIVLPARPSTTGELSEEELERVAGGITPTISAAVAISFVGVAATAISASATVVAAQDSGW
jgi:hypothetical protein